MSTFDYLRQPAHDPRFRIDDAQWSAFIASGDWHLPKLNDESPAGALTNIVDDLLYKGVIVRDERYALVLINDDEMDINGLVINVRAQDTSWPAISDGWSELDNYLPHDDEEPGDHAGALREAVDSIVNRANALVMFLTVLRGNSVAPQDWHLDWNRTR